MYLFALILLKNNVCWAVCNARKIFYMSAMTISLIYFKKKTPVPNPAGYSLTYILPNLIKPIKDYCENTTNPTTLFSFNDSKAFLF